MKSLPDTDEILLFEPPSKKLVERITAPLRWYFAPVFEGLEHVDAGRPRLYVGNHVLYSTDWPLLVAELYQRKNIFLRSLGDRLHNQVPLWRGYTSAFGVVEGSRENCAALMEAGEHILVYPGGAREVCTRKGEQYMLTWKERTGFVHMAIKHGYDIVPVASVGGDSAYDILIDAKDVMGSPVGAVLRATGLMDGLLRGGDIIPPVPRGLGWTLFPRPERYYFRFGKPVSVARYKGKHDNQRTLLAVRNRVARALENLIQELLLQRERDRDSGLIRRFLTRP